MKTVNLQEFLIGALANFVECNNEPVTQVVLVVTGTMYCSTYEAHTDCEAARPVIDVLQNSMDSEVLAAAAPHGVG